MDEAARIGVGLAGGSAGVTFLQHYNALSRREPAVAPLYWAVKRAFHAHLRAHPTLGR